MVKYKFVHRIAAVLSFAERVNMQTSSQFHEQTCRHVQENPSPTNHLVLISLFQKGFNGMDGATALQSLLLVASSANDGSGFPPAVKKPSF